MKKIKRRAYSVILITLAVVVGISVYFIRLSIDGKNWAMLGSNQAVFNQGVLDTGTLTDRNGIVLAKAGDGIFSYAEDAATRIACLHVAGDYNGNIGTGAITQFASRLAGYDLVGGVNSLSGKGKTLRLSVDSQLNTAAYSALNGRKGAVLVSNYRTGQILCMVSSPSYDPVNPPDLNNSRYEGVFLNRCLSSAYAPGSVYKLITLAAAIENKPDLYQHTFSCAGSVIVGGEQVNCTGYHGSQTIEQALANSCNCAFSELSQELSGDVLARYANELGMVDSFEVSGIETAMGSFQKAEEGSADLSWSGIGQYKDLVTPAAMLRLVGAIANDGLSVSPALIKNEKTSKTTLLSKDTAAKIGDMMAYNMSYSYGQWLFPDLNACAKTGTAEVGDGSPHAWFVGFLREEKYPLAFVVVIENGGGGLVNAAPVASAVIKKAVEDNS